MSRNKLLLAIIFFLDASLVWIFSKHSLWIFYLWNSLTLLALLTHLNIKVENCKHEWEKITRSGLDPWDFPGVFMKRKVKLPFSLSVKAESEILKSKGGHLTFIDIRQPIWALRLQNIDKNHLYVILNWKLMDFIHLICNFQFFLVRWQ